MGFLFVSCTLDRGCFFYCLCVMSNFDFLFSRVELSRVCLKVLFDSLSESACSDPKVFALVSESLVNMNNLLEYIESLKVS